MAPSNPDDFDGYRKWLGIANKKRAPTHYELLAISLDEDDPEVIRSATEQRRHYVESKRGEGHDAIVTEILYRIDEAEATLLNEEMRRDYDRAMSLFEKRRKNRQVDPNAPRSRVRSQSGRTVGEDGGIVKTFVGIMAVVCIGFGGMAWLSFQLPWFKKPKEVEIAPAPVQQPQPIVVQAVQPPAAIQAQPVDPQPIKSVDVAMPPVAQNQNLLGATLYQGHNYKVFREALDWKTAKSRCEAIGGHLVTISNEQENKFITALATKTLGDINNSGIWLGATDERKEGEWEWIDGTPFNYSAWFDGQPNGKDKENFCFLLLYFKGAAGKEFRGWCDQPQEGKIHVTYYACEWDSIQNPMQSVEPEKPKDSAEISLLSGKLLDTWQAPKKDEDISNWLVANGILSINANGPSLRTKQTFRDFDLHLEFKLPSKCNAGVYLRGRYEVQLLDNEWRTSKGTPPTPVQSCGAIYGQAAPSQNVYRGPDKWNTLDVRLFGEVVTVRMNEVTIIDAFTLNGTTSAALDENESDPGPIVLQSASPPGPEFRNIRIKPVANENLVVKLPKPVLQLSFDANQTPGVRAELHGATFVKGRVGKALQFDGRSYAVVNHNLPIGNSPRSLAVWLKNTRGPVNDRLFHVVTQGPVNSGTVFGIMEAGGKWRFFDFIGGLDSGIQVDTAWHHHCVTFDGTKVVYFLDGKLVSEVNRSLNTTVSPLFLGTMTADDKEKRYKGLIDELMIYDVPLTQDQVAELIKRDESENTGTK